MIGTGYRMKMADTFHSVPVETAIELDDFTVSNSPQISQSQDNTGQTRHEARHPGLINLTVGQTTSPISERSSVSAVLDLSIRGRVYRFMTDSQSSRGAFVWSIFVLFIILSSIVIFCLETLPVYYSEEAVSPWSELEIVISSIFTVDIVLRLLSCPSYKQFFKDPFTWIDFLSIVPFYVELIFSSGVSGLKVIRVVRLCRVFRIFRLGKYSNSLVVVVRTVMISWHILVVLLVIGLLLILVFATFIFHVERGSWSRQYEGWVLNDSKSSFQDIRDALWFCVITATTVGYGDIYPVTGWGKLLSGAMIFIGTLSVAFPITVICSNFTLEWTELKNSMYQRRLQKRSRNPKHSSEEEETRPHALEIQECKTIRDMIFLTFEDPGYSTLAQGVSIGMLILVLLSIIGMVVGSVESFSQEHGESLFILESIIIAIFTFEYIVRIATCRNRLRYMLRPFNVIDIISIIPYYISFIFGSNADGLVALRIFRLARVFRVFRLGKYSQGFEILVRTLVQSVDELGLLIFLLAVLLVLSSSIMYYSERGDYREGHFCESAINDRCVYSKYESVVLTFWWCIATVATLGYGDVFPKTIIGRGVTSITALLGIMTLAFPIAVLGNNFSEQWKTKTPSPFSVMLARKAEATIISNSDDDDEIEEMTKAKSLFLLHPRRLYFTFTDPDFSPTAYVLSVFYIVLVMLSVVTFCYESTLQEGSAEAKDISLVETVVIALFTLEYVISVFFAPRVLRKMRSLPSIVDLVSILPFYIELAITSDAPGLAVLRVIRLARVFRMFRVSKVAENFQMIALTLLKSFDALLLLVLVISLEVVIFSSAIFYAERGVYEEGKGWFIDGERSQYQSVPESFWWAIVTVSTVGYGDVVPKTVAGRIIGGLTVISGVLSLAFPITIISNNFMDEWLRLYYLRTPAQNPAPQNESTSKSQLSRTSNGTSSQTTKTTSISAVLTVCVQCMMIALHMVSGIAALVSMIYSCQTDETQRIM
eukprot:TRINITY_DN10099_c0_g3_i19.p1 TRINITY_DN10099_c0_g3~~TRINITY_DN10099_c0_g3_i19.p1  ORF type:complete len:992 (+),score=110.20 TRINITY_DN10099_c0_g3_i19:188-3163(+)